MTLRNASAKFSLPSFGRRNTSGEGPSSPNRTTNGTGFFDDDGFSPGKDRDRDTSGGGGGLDAIGKKLGKTLAHQSLLPALGNRDLRALQDVISSEKSVLQVTEKLAIESSKAAAALPAYGSFEGPDLQDVLTHSSTLLNHLSAAFHVFTDHQSNMRGCYKRIREREEALDELRRRRRATGAKAENAEKKLAKMGPEHKGLPQQTDLLERLRSEMRQMDTNIVNEESRIGDFKRQILKEALSLKFGGLEELGEKMCIIGELGKLLLEEIPLEETPPGHQRARYTGYDKTENAVNEATKCLATVKFQAANNSPRPHVPPQAAPYTNHTPHSFPHHSQVAAAEDFANYPGNVASPPTAAPRAGAGYFSLDESDPYGGVAHNPYRGEDHAYGEYGGMRGAGSGNHVVFQGPPDTPAGRNGHDKEESQEGAVTDHAGVEAHDYEFEQQRQLDEERVAAERSAPAPDLAVDTSEAMADADESDVVNNDISGSKEELKSPWEPLNVRRDHSVTPEPQALRDANLGAPLSASTTDTDHTAQPNHTIASPSSIELPPAPSFFNNPSIPTPGERDGAFYTPMEGPAMTMPDALPIPAHTESNPAPSNASFAAAPVGGKISAAAFRRVAKPRASLEPEESNSPPSNTVRRLPVPPPPGRSETPVEAGVALPASPVVTTDDHAFEQRFALGRRVDNDSESFAEAKGEASAPPRYSGDSLR